MWTGAAVFLATVTFLVSGCDRDRFSETAFRDRAVDLQGLTEASMNFDTEDVLPFLRRIVPLIDSGFGEREAREVSATADSLAVHRESILEYEVAFRSETTRLVVYIFKDDVDAPDIAIFTAPDLARRIDREMVEFAREQEAEG